MPLAVAEEAVGGGGAEKNGDASAAIDGPFVDDEDGR